MSVTSISPALPAVFSDRLTDEQKQLVFEAPRGQRLKILSAELKATEPETLASLAIASGVTVASNLEADHSALSLFPARLVHDYQAVPIVYAKDGAPQTELS